ncbi:unnamed protein product [Dicrocoelium dendriticum]|nr:unnamed protein product [Dicrocoelium dendriticum]CAH8654672.1 unnamed protein product [Dicrocoelium dendriticum]
MVCQHPISSTLTILLMFNILHLGDTLDCFQCNSHLQVGCSPLDRNLFQPTTCPSAAVSCDILEQKAPFFPDPTTNRTMETRILRFCSPVEDAHNGCYDRLGASKVNMRYCSCTGDGCNPALRVRSRFAGLFTTLLLFLTCWII